MADSLTFISPGILERVENGSFVPARRAQSASTGSGGERRRVLSPLAVTKRCIRYEPNVFYQRKPQILELAYTLNRPEQKILLLGGPQGSGKTSLIRGLIELMGSRHEQLLWFDVNRHTDFEEIIHFLIHYITYVCMNADLPTPEGRGPDRRLQGREESGKEQAGSDRRQAERTQQPVDPSQWLMPQAPKDEQAEEPIQKLEKLIRQVGDMPLLLVLDNVEYIVNPELRFNSFPFKEILNFLLGFANIKMILIGERLPYADMSPNQMGVTDLTLGGLTEAATLTLMHAKRNAKATVDTSDPAILEWASAPDAETEALKHLYGKTQGFPWLLKIILHLNHQCLIDFYTLNRLLESGHNEDDGPKSPTLLSTGRLPIPELLRLIYQRLPDQHRLILQLMSFLRHPASTQSLLAMVSLAYPSLDLPHLEIGALEDILEHSLLRSLLKISYPPQEVLMHVRTQKEKMKNDGKNTDASAALPRANNPFERPAETVTAVKYKPGYELYHMMKRLISRTIKPAEKARIHQLLQEFYLRERSQDADKRILRIKNRALLSEAKFHGNAARGRKTGSEEATGTDDRSPIMTSTSSSSGGNRLTLDDYKRLNLPELEIGEAAETSLAGPTFMERLEAAAASPMLLPGVLRSPASEAFPTLTAEEQALLTSPAVYPAETEQRDASERPLTESNQAKPTSAHNTPDWHALTQDLMNAAHTTDEQEREIEKRLATAVSQRNQPALVRELVELARYRAGKGNYQSAAQCLEKAQHLHDKADRDVLAELYRLSGSVHKETYHHNTALGALSKAATQIRKLMYEDETVNSVWLGRLGQVYQDLGEIHAYRKQYADAVEAFEQAMRWYHSADDDGHEAETHFQLALALEDAGRSEEAIDHYQHALRLDEANGNWLPAAAAHSNLGNLYLTMDRLKDSRAAFLQAIALDQKSQNIEGQLNSWECLVTLYIRQESLEAAEQGAKQALSIAIQEGQSLWQASFYMRLGQVAALQSHWQEAHQQYKRARVSGDRELSQASLDWLDQQIENTLANHRAEG